jgi:hypothetical protein
MTAHGPSGWLEERLQKEMPPGDEDILHIVRWRDYPIDLCGRVVHDEFSPRRTDTAGTVMTIPSFYFGSSCGGREKDAILGRAVEGPDDAADDGGPGRRDRHVAPLLSGRGPDGLSLASEQA